MKCEPGLAILDTQLGEDGHGCILLNWSLTEPPADVKGIVKHPNNTQIHLSKGLCGELDRELGLKLGLKINKGALGINNTRNNSALHYMCAKQIGTGLQAFSSPPHTIFNG